MVKLDVVRHANSALFQSQPLVAVVVGGTSGIGEHTIHALASATASTAESKGVRIYFVGRREASATRIIAEVLKVCPSAEIIFVQADVSLLKEVDRVCKEISELERKKKGEGEGRGNACVDLLVLSQGVVYFDGRRETAEGLDAFMSLIYYSRIRFILQFLPLLLASSLPAHVISVFGPHRGEKFIKDDVSLRNPKNYGFMVAGSHAAYMKTFLFTRLATLHPGLSFTHYFPSIVLTEAFNDPSHPFWLRWAVKILRPFIGWMTVPPPESGERVLFLASPKFPAGSEQEAEEKAKNVGLDVAMGQDGVRGGGAYRVDWDGEVMSKEQRDIKALKEDGWEEKVWDHTMKAFDEIEQGKKFTA